MKQLALLVIFATTLASAYARQIDESTAGDIAKAFFMKKSDKVQSPKLIHDSEDIRTMRKVPSLKGTAQQPSFYIFSRDNEPDNKGFVIVSADDELKPIIGWSDNAVFDVKNMPVQLVDFLQEYDNWMSELRAGNATAAKTAGGTAVSPLLTTQWDQGEPYNLYTPSYGAYNAPTGCVATAMAQVMKYYNYPPTGHGRIEGWSYAKDDVNLSESVYDWDNMLDSYDYEQYTRTEAEAVGRLMYDAGRAVEMMYGSNQSGAFDAYIPGAMYKYFNYDAAIAYKSREYYDSQTWINIIRENLLRGEPVLYSGASDRGGHQFVCDGIDDNDYLHINWGWSGSCDGYFDINAFTPTTVGIGGGDGNYYKEHTAIINIRPGDPDADNTGYIRPPVIYEGHWVNSDWRTSSLYIKIYNDCFKDRNAGSISFIVDLYDTDKNLIKESVTISDLWYLLKANTVKWVELNIDLTSVADGEYFIGLRHGTDKAPFDFAGEELIPTKITNGKAVVEYVGKKVDSEAITIEKVEQRGPIYEIDTQPYIEITVRNNYSYMLSPFYVDAYCLPEAESSEVVDVNALKSCGRLRIDYLYDGAHRSEGMTMSFSNRLQPGKYRLLFAVNGDIVKTESDCDITVLHTPTDKPLLLLSPLTNNYPDPDNGPWNNMQLSFTYTTPGDWAHWYNDDVSLQLWASNDATPDEEFLLSEISRSGLEYTPNSSQTIEIDCYPDLKWRVPGSYRMWLKYTIDGEWVTIPGENNLCHFNVTNYIPSFPYLEMAEPAVINGGHPVEIGKEFEVKLKLRSPSGISMHEEHARVFISLSPLDELNTFASDWSPVADTWELAPGESCNMTMKFNLNEFWAEAYEYDLQSIIGKRLVITPFLAFFGNNSLSQTVIIYNEHIPSLYFTPVEASGIDEIVVDNVNTAIDYSAHYEVYNLNGIKLSSDIHGLAPGLYIVRQGSAVKKIAVN